MKIIRRMADWQPGSNVCLAIGVFDGVHLGHQQVIRQTIADARKHAGTTVVATFDRHPNAVVAPDRVPPLIYPLWRKVRAIEELGVDALLLLTFSEDLRMQSGEAFIRALARHVAPLRSICVGEDFVFGHKRSGNVDLMRRLGAELDFQVHGHAAVALDNRVVSSTGIREFIRAGQLDQASQMLGRDYSLNGRVIRGDGVGRRLGFPTANLEVAGMALPPNGVHAVLAACRGRVFQAVLNIGTRPTVQNPTPELRAEVHLLDFDSDLYGTEMELTFVERLRDERRFGSLSDLKQQIGRDVEQARNVF